MKERLTLYHGSCSIIEHPQFGKGRPYNDYGLGFYCTEHVELAREWACVSAESDGYVNRYHLDLRGLSVLDLSSGAYGILHWLALLLENRVVDTSLPLAAQGKAYLREQFAVDTRSFDVIRGYRADDSYFSFARAFLGNAISVEQLAGAMKLGDLGEQIVLKSERAFNLVDFVSADPVASAVYYPKRKQRDDEARAHYRAQAQEQGLKGLYLLDLVREGIGANDARLR
ncbi:MAG: DUF3990 domain-containing protein [Gordonibacter sp.]|uniref:DUF3990 domain-containing protein n=1 Tax=Gordonibacter sp. TaxID=1968902 RepID=UPI002FC82FA6